MRTLPERLRDILRAIDAIEETVREGEEPFFLDKYRQVWVVYHLQIIGEAIRPVAGELTMLCPDYPWAEAVGMRNILIHGYFGIDLRTVWDTAQQDLPRLRQVATDLLYRPSAEG